MADVNDDDAPATKRDLRELEARLDANLEAKLDAKLAETKRELIEVISSEISRATQATEENIRRWFGALVDKQDSDVAATNANVATLRDEFEAHREDTKVHVTRAPRRRSRG